MVRLADGEIGYGVIDELPCEEYDARASDFPYRFSTFV
jgi:hypothetical protein